MDEIPEYSAPNASALDPHKKAIAERRRKKWPYKAILQWLKDEHKVSVVYSTLWEYCLRRGITKGGVALPKPPGAGAGRHGSDVAQAPTGASQPEPEPLDLLADAESRLAAAEPENPFVKVRHRSLPK
jgi:hypothetical protein